MCALSVHLLFIPSPDCVHWQENRSVRKMVHDAGRSTPPATGVSSRANSKKEGTIAMNYFKVLLPKTLWMGTIGVAAMLLGWTPSCKAQEVSPAIFTNTGVEDVYPTAKPVAKKPAKVQVVAHANQGAASNDAYARKQNAHRVARKPNVASAPVV
jgi:hypothetical protein